MILEQKWREAEESIRGLSETVSLLFETFSLLIIVGWNSFSFQHVFRCFLVGTAMPLAVTAVGKSWLR